MAVDMDYLSSLRSQDPNIKEKLESDRFTKQDFIDNKRNNRNLWFFSAMTFMHLKHLQFSL